MVAAHDLAQWVALMLARRTEARLDGSEVEIPLAADERTTLANLSLTSHAIRRKIQSAPPLECVRLSGEELCQLLMALSGPLSSARASSDSFLSNLATKLLEHVKQLLAANEESSAIAISCTDASMTSGCTFRAWSTPDVLRVATAA